MSSSFGERLRVARAKAGLTQGELADKVGIDYSEISKAENGHRISFISQLKLDRELGLGIDDAENYPRVVTMELHAMPLWAEYFFRKALREGVIG